MEDSRTCGETPSNSKGVKNLNKKNVDHTASDLSAELRKLKQAYESLSSKKDKEVSVLLSEKDYARKQWSIVQQNYDELLKKMRVEAAQATGARQKLQKNVDDLKVLAQKKDNEIGRMQAEAAGAKNKLQKMQSLAKEKDDELQRLKCLHPEPVQMCNKDISVTHKRSRSGDPDVTLREPENNGLGQTTDDKISETKRMRKNGQDETTLKRRGSSMSNDDERSGSDEDDAEQIESDEDGDKRSGSDVDGDEQSGSDENGNEQSGNGEHGDSADDNDEQSGSDEETTHSQVQKPPGYPTRRYRPWFRNGDVMTWWGWKAPPPLCSKKLQISNGQRISKTTGNWEQYVKAVNDSLVEQPDKHKEFVRILRNFENWRARDVARTMYVLLDGQPNLIRQLNQFLPTDCQIKVEEEKQQPKHQLRLSRLRPLPSAVAAAGLIKLSKEEHQLQREQV